MANGCSQLFLGARTFPFSLFHEGMTHREGSQRVDTQTVPHGGHSATVRPHFAK